MKREHHGPGGLEIKVLDVDQQVLSPEEVARQAARPVPEPPAQGPEVAIDPQWPNLKLPEHPRNAGWIVPDPDEPLT